MPVSVSPFLLLCLVGLFSIFSSTISKNPALPLLVESLGADGATIGMVAGISALTGILFSLPAGFLSDRIGRHRMLLVSGIVFATAPFAYLMATQIWQIAVIRFYHGLATAVFGPVAMAFVVDLYQESRGEKLGWFSTATLLGRFMAPAAGGMLLGMGAVGSSLNFSLLYLVCGAAGACALFGIILISHSPKTKPACPPSRQKPLKKAIGSGLFRNPFLLSTCIVEAAILFSYGIFETFLPIRGLQEGLSALQIGICISSQILTIAVIKPVSGSFSDRHSRPPQILTGAIFTGSSMVLLAFATFFWQLLAVSILLGVGISVVTAATAAHIADVSKTGAHGAAMGALGSIMDIGHTTGPVVAGAVAVTLGLQAAFLCGAAVMLAVSAAFFLLHAGYGSGTNGGQMR